MNRLDEFRHLEHGAYPGETPRGAGLGSNSRGSARLALRERSTRVATPRRRGDHDQY